MVTRASSQPSDPRPPATFLEMGVGSRVAISAVLAVLVWAALALAFA